MEIKVMTSEEANEFLDQDDFSAEFAGYEPLGSFKVIYDDYVVGIDNRNGDALVEEFDHEETCDRWLRGEIEI